MAARWRRSSPSPTPLNEGISPTTGRPLPEGAVYRPVLVAMDNAAQARPQTALMLAERGMDCEVYEQASEIRELGVGINTLPHAIRELADLGHLQGLVRRIDEIEALHPDLQAPLETLRALALELRFDALIHILDGVADDCPDTAAP